MSVVCPQGHTSATEDFCDVCGTPISPAQAAQPAVQPTAQPTAQPAEQLAEPPPTRPSDQAIPPPPTAVPASQGPAQPKACPNCDAENAGDALFCEDCGYDFATGQLPPPPATIDPVSGRAVAAPVTLAGIDWVAEVWVDPDWFTHQQAEGTCPTSGVPTVVPLKGAVQLVGRKSRSRNINPEIDCSGDGAISHRHAELSRTGERWSVKDLGSTNGTYVGRPGAALPDDALAPHQARELADDERIYLGAWTRIMVRRATDSERAGRS